MRIGIVHQDPLERACLRHLVARRAGWRVAWDVDRGEAALARCRAEPPALLLFGLGAGMPVAPECVRALVESVDCPVLLVVDSLRATRGLVFEALRQGARDVVRMSREQAQQPARVADFWKKLEALVQREGSPVSRPMPPTLVAIGASSGGPRAVARLLAGLRAELPASIVVVMHIGRRAAPGMADWLAQHASMPVVLAEEGMRPEAGRVALAATDHHLTLNARLRWHYREEPKDCSYRPSVDVCLGSIVAHWPHRAIGVLLTGMGHDGARGLKAMRERGWLTIAQDEHSADVYGMPRAAKAMGAAVRVLPLERIAPTLSRALAAVDEGGLHAVSP